MWIFGCLIAHVIIDVTTCRPQSNKCTRTELFPKKRDLDVRENSNCEHERKKFSLSFIVGQSLNVAAVLSGKAYYCETWITYSSITRHATQKTARHDTPSKKVFTHTVYLTQQHAKSRFCMIILSSISIIQQYMPPKM